MPATSTSPTGAAAPPSPTGRRDRKKAATRDALRAAAFGLFATRGYAQTRVSDITESADVSTATFFRYFASKDEIVLADVRARFDAAVDAAVSRPRHEHPIEASRAVARAPESAAFTVGPSDLPVMALVATDATLGGLLMAHVGGCAERLAADFADRLDVAPSSLDAHLLAQAVMAAMTAVLRVWLTDTTQDPRALTLRALDRLAAGFGG